MKFPESHNLSEREVKEVIKEFTSSELQHFRAFLVNQTQNFTASNVQRLIDHLEERLIT